MRSQFSSYLVALILLAVPSVPAFADEHAEQSYNELIMAKIRKAWFIPKEVPAGARCTVNARQLKSRRPYTGVEAAEIYSFEIEQCDNETLARSVKATLEREIWLPLPPLGEKFNPQLRLVFVVPDDR